MELSLDLALALLEDRCLREILSCLFPELALATIGEKPLPTPRRVLYEGFFIERPPLGSGKIDTIGEVPLRGSRGRAPTGVDDAGLNLIPTQKVRSLCKYSL